MKNAGLILIISLLSIIAVSLLWPSKNQTCERENIGHSIEIGDNCQTIPA